MEKKVSIIVSVYNEEQYVREMIDSIISQTYDNWELIIIDDASKDDTWSIISSYSDGRIIPIRNEVNRGLTVNLNRAWSLSHGEYIMRMDGDDIAYTGRLKKQIDYMESHPDTIISGGGMAMVGDFFGVYEPEISPEINKVLLIFNVVIGHPTMVIRRKTADRYGLKYNENLRYAQDYDLEYRASKMGDISNVRNCVVKYRTHSNQVTFTNHKEQLLCADTTRKKILEDLGIVLNEQEYALWRDFCIENYDSCKRELKLVYEVCSRIKENNKVLGFYDEGYLEGIIESRIKRAERYNDLLDDSRKQQKYAFMFQIQSLWSSNIRMGKTIGDWLLQRGLKTISVYGMGLMGKNLVDEIVAKDELHVAFLFDRDVVGEYKQIRILNSISSPIISDVLIITPVSQFDLIKESFIKSFEGEIISLADIINEISLT